MRFLIPITTIVFAFAMPSDRDLAVMDPNYQHMPLDAESLRPQVREVLHDEQRLIRDQTGREFDIVSEDTIMTRIMAHN